VELALARRLSPLAQRRLTPSTAQPLVNSQSRGRDRRGTADLDVSAKLPEQCLERGEEAEAFPGR
jgi:hypothetical protein